MSEGQKSENNGGLRVTRRGALVGGALGVAAAVGVSEAEPSIALATTPALTQTEPLPSGTTAPEQLRLAWGANPSTQVTVSWSAPGQTAMPAPTLAFSTSPISAGNPGKVVTLPAPQPFSLATPRTGPSSTYFTDGLSQQTTYHYHVPLTDLTPGTNYYYQVSDGAGTPSTANGEFTTAPSGRSSYRFTAFGDIGTTSSQNPSGYQWTESSDTSIYTIKGIISPGDGAGAGLFHLMLADLSYANVNPANAPNIWRDYQHNASLASMNQPWMPIQGNHEVEYGICNAQGVPTSGQIYNGPYGAGNYLARHLLPDNGLTNWDGNSLQGSFYSFQVGTVLFVCLNTNDIVYQNPQTISTTGSKSYAGTYNGGTVPAGGAVGQYQSTGNLKAGGTGIQLVPDTGSGTPNLQTEWLAQTLAAARTSGSGVDMIVVCEHHCALSTGPNNGVDLAIRAAWLPLYDQYEVDLVIGGHDHDYERSFPVRGYTAPAGTTTAAFTNAWGTYTSGQTIDTRTPNVVTTQPTQLQNGLEAWNTAAGTVFLQLGGAGAAAGNAPKAGKNSPRAAEIWALNQGGTGATQTASEDAPWSANYDTSDNYGYAVFDVIPGSAPGDTQIRYQWFQVPTVAAGGTVTLPVNAYEEFVFTRFMPTAGAVSISGATGGSVQQGGVLAATVSGWPGTASYAYQWLSNGSPISGATGSSYTTGSADAGQSISVMVTVTAPGYPTGSADSSAVSVTSVPPTTVTTTTTTPGPTTTVTTPGQTVTTPGPTTTVTTPGQTVTTPAGATAVALGVIAIGGTPKVGDKLHAEVSGVTPGAKLSYQWLRAGAAISGATASVYKAVAADAGKLLRVKVTAKLAGSTASAETAAVKVAESAFKKTSKPKITGTAVVGHKLTAAVEAWAPEANFSYEWLLSGRPIAGATRRTLSLVAPYVGKQLTVRVTGTAADDAREAVTSVAVVVSGSPLRAVRPRLSGKALVGYTLHVHIGSDWPAGTDFVYRWFSGTAAIPNVTGHALRLGPEYRGHRISVEVTGRLAGHESVRAVSAPTRAVRRPWTIL